MLRFTYTFATFLEIRSIWWINIGKADSHVSSGAAHGARNLKWYQAESSRESRVSSKSSDIVDSLDDFQLIENSRLIPL